MEAVKHTEGSWEACKIENTSRVDVEEVVFNISDRDGNSIAETTPVIKHENDNFDADVRDAETHAHLIAAAPDLLKACKIALHRIFMLDRDCENSKAYRDLNHVIAKAEISVQEHENTQARPYRKAKEKSRPLQDIIDRSNEVIARATEPEGAILKSEAQVKELREAVRKLFNPITFGQKKLIIDKVLASTGTDHLKKELKYVNRFLELVTDMERSVHSPRCSHCATDFTESELHQDSCPIGRMRAILEKRKAELERALG